MTPEMEIYEDILREAMIELSRRAGTMPKRMGHLVRGGNKKYPPYITRILSILPTEPKAGSKSLDISVGAFQGGSARGVDRGWIYIDRTTRPYTHRITPEGKAVLKDVMTEQEA